MFSPAFDLLLGLLRTARSAFSGNHFTVDASCTVREHLHEREQMVDTDFRVIPTAHLGDGEQ